MTEAERRAERDAAEELVARASTNESSEKLAEGSMSGRTTPSTAAIRTTTTTSEVITKASVNVASGPARARLREDAERGRRAPRHRERAPEERDAEERAPWAARANGMSGRAATKNTAVTTTRTKTHCRSIAQPRPRRPCASPRCRARRRPRAR